MSCPPPPVHEATRPRSAPSGEGLFADVKRQPPTPIRRQYGDGFVVDEVMWNGYIADGKITREAVWCDLAAIQAQLA